MKEEMWRFNGLVLLYAYLQRIFVHERILQLFGAHGNPERLELLPAMIETVTEVVQSAETHKNISQEQVGSLIPVLERVENWIADYLPKGEELDDLHHRFAIAASAIHGEEHVNNGLIKLGELFDPGIADRFMQRVSGHKNNVGIASTVVAKTVRNEPIEESFVQKMENWYRDVSSNAGGMKSDLAGIRVMLQGKPPNS